LQAEGNDFAEELRQPMRLFVYETLPYLWLSDGFHYIEAHFTKESLNEFRKTNSTFKFTNLRDRIVFVYRWHLELRQ